MLVIVLVIAQSPGLDFWVFPVLLFEQRIGDSELCWNDLESGPDLQRFLRSGRTLLFCSHALYYVSTFCSRALWLHHGKAQAYGRVGDPTVEFIDPRTSIGELSEASLPTSDAEESAALRE